MSVYRESSEEKVVRVALEIEEAKYAEAIAEKERIQELKIREAELKADTKVAIVGAKYSQRLKTVHVCVMALAYIVFIVMCGPLLILTKREVPWLGDLL